jgi:hydrogenase maturation protease
MNTLVLGIGNTLLTDEGIGVHVTRYLSQQHPPLPDTDFIDGGTLSFTLAGDIETAGSLVVIDATQLNELPGSVRAFIGDEMDAFLGGQSKRSVHEVGLMDLLSIARLTGHLPDRRALIGIQPHNVDWGEFPTEAVQAAIPVAGNMAIQLIQEWQT